MRKICIAPTGGGFDSGVTANGLHEKDITLAIALSLKSALDNAGVPVVLSRDGDYPAGNATTTSGILEHEVAASNNASADLFVKLALNSTAQGPSATVHTGSSVETVALDLVHAVGKIIPGTGTPEVNSGETYVLVNTSAPAIILHLCNLEDASAAGIVHSKAKDIGSAIAGVLADWAKGTEHAPAETGGSDALDYRIDYQPVNNAQSSSEATIKKWAALLGIPEWIALSIAIVESDLDPNALGDVENGHPTSFGLYQLHTPNGQGAGYTEQQLLDPDLNCHIGLSHMTTALKNAEAHGLDHYPLLRYVASYSGHPDETGNMPESYDAALKVAYTKVTGLPADPAPATEAPQASPDPTQEAIDFVVQHGIMTTVNGDFRPNEPVNRWQVAVIVERLYKLIRG